MPIRCVERPNRKGPRLFDEGDLVRIAKYVKRDSKLGVWKILFLVAGALGVGAFLCRLVKTLKRFGLIIKFIKWFASGVVIVRAMEIFAEWVLKSKISIIPIIRSIALAIAVLSLVLSKLIEAAIETLKDTVFISEAVEALSEGCEYIGEKIEDIELPDLPDLPDLPNLKDIPNPLE